MTRFVLIVAIVSEAIVISIGAAPCPAQETKTPAETLIRLSVAGAAEPRPALRYLLLPELKETSPGNPIQEYLKCNLEQYRFAFDEREFEQRKALLSMPLEELPSPDVPQLSRVALEHADRAARLDNPDWQILLKLKENGVATLLPDVQGMRNLARALQGRLRNEIASGRLGDAIRTAKTMFAMSRHMGEHPTMIGDLIGIAIALSAIEPLQEMLEHPDCPNLYWALTNLPDPFITIKKGLDGERLIVETVFRDLDQAAPMNAGQIKHAIDELEKLDSLFNTGQVNNQTASLPAYLAECTKNPERMAEARKHLISGGLPEASAKTFPPEQVILLDEARACLIRFDDLAKLMVLPAWQFEEATRPSRTAAQEPAFFADLILRFLPLLRQAQARLEQRFALLRHVEALRMYAAAHNAFPSNLSEILVPLPADSISGKPFSYESSGKTAHLRGTPPRPFGDQTGAYRLHYEDHAQELKNPTYDTSNNDDLTRRD